MLSPLLLTPDRAETSIPLDAFAQAMKEKARERPGAKMGDADCKAFALWHASMGPGTATFETDEGTQTREIRPSRRGEVIWLPVHAIVRVRPAEGSGWAIGITRNGTLRWAAGADSPVSCEPEPAPEGAAEGVASTLRWLAEGDVGQSSLALAHRLMGVPDEVSDPQAHPRDAADLARCLAFLDAVHPAAKNLHRMADVSPVWASLVADWDGLTILFKGEQAAGLAHRESQEALRVALERAKPVARPRP